MLVMFDLVLEYEEMLKKGISNTDLGLEKGFKSPPLGGQYHILAKKN